MKNLTIYFIILIVLFSTRVLFPQKWERFYEEEEASFRGIISLCIDSNNYVYVNNPFEETLIKLQDTEIYDLTNKDIKKNNFNYPYNVKDILYNKYDNKIWCATEGGLLVYDIEKDTTIITNASLMNEGDADYSFFLSLTFDQDEKMWFTARNPYISYFDGNKFVDYYIWLNNKIHYINIIENKIITDRNNNIWVTGHGALKILPSTTEDSLHYSKYNFEEFNKNDVELVELEEVGDSIWASFRNENEKVYYYTDDEWNELVIPEEFRDYTVINGNGDINFISNISKDKSGNIYLFWVSSNFFIKIKENGVFEKINFPIDDLTKESFILFVKSVELDKYGKLWIASLEDGLFVYETITTSIEDSNLDINLTLGINIFPNPATDEIEVTGIENAIMLEIEIFNTLGIKVISSKLTTSNKINVSHLPTGMYIIKIGNRVTKFIKK